MKSVPPSISYWYVILRDIKRKLQEKKRRGGGIVMLVIASPFYWGTKGRSEKHEFLGGLKVFLPQIFDRGLTTFLAKKDFVK